jgi:hypothetical protein
MTIPTMTQLRSAAVYLRLGVRLGLGLGLVALPGCPLADVQADVPEVCLTYTNLQVTTPAVASLTQSFVFDDLSAAHDLAKQSANLEFVRAEVRVTSGVENLSFIDAVHVVVSSQDPGTALPPLTIYDCDGDCVPDGDTLEVPAALADNAVAYLRSNAIKIDLAFQGQIPAASWTMDVDVCMKGNAGYTVAP